MRIGIIGTGAMASLFASRLSLMADVTLIGTWQDQIDAINQNGLTVIQLDGSETNHPITATSQWDGLTPVDIALVLTKSYQTVEAIDRVDSVLAPYGAVITCQNGLGNLEQLSDYFGDDRATVAVTSIGATTIRPGVVRHAGEGPIHLAQPPQLIRRLGGIISYLRGAGFNLHVVQSAESLLWGKVIINAGINPITAILGQTNGYLMQDGAAKRLMLAATREAAAVAAAQGIDLPYDDPETEVMRVATATAANRSSMLQDIDRGAPTEIDAISGEIWRIGQQYNIATPINHALYQAIITLESNQPISTKAILSLVE